MDFVVMVYQIYQLFPDGKSAKIQLLLLRNDTTQKK